MADIVLASASPRRRELLRLITTDFETAVSDAEETAAVPQDLSAIQLSGYWARVKAEDAAVGREEKLVIGSDTAVLAQSSDGSMQVLGKPVDETDARRMLHLLSGQKHLVSTGCCLCWRGESRTFVEVAEVEFYPLSEAEIDAYIAKNEWRDKAGNDICNTSKPRHYWEGKAGAYGIQDPFGAKFIKRIEGDYYAIMGLPVSRLYHEILNLGIKL